MKPQRCGDTNRPHSYTHTTHTLAYTGGDVAGIRPGFRQLANGRAHDPPSAGRSVVLCELKSSRSERLRRGVGVD